MSKVWDYLKRWQELFGWAPIAAAIVFALWIVVGALDRLAIVDALAVLVSLALVTVAGLLASGLTYLVWRRFSIRLTGAEVDDYWKRLMAGERGPLIVFGINAGFYLCAFIVSAWLFSLPLR